MIVWGSPSDPEIRDYLRRYGEFQTLFCDCSRRLFAGALGVEFPEGACRPPVPPRVVGDQKIDGTPPLPPSSTPSPPI